MLSEEELVSEDGEVANVFVYISSGLEDAEYPVPEEIATLDQKGCAYHPRVQGVILGQEFNLTNSDPLLHNSRSYARRNRPFNYGQPAGTKPRGRPFVRKEPAVRIKCDVHTWMVAYIFAMDHPFFAVTDDAGKFKIEGLPAGDYTLTAWHEKYGELDMEITVGETAFTGGDFTFTPSEK